MSTLALNGRAGRKVVLPSEYEIMVRERSGFSGWRRVSDVAAGPSAKGGGVANWHTYVCLPVLATEVSSLDLVSLLPSMFRDIEGRVVKTSPSKYAWDYSWNIDNTQPLDEALGYLLGIFAAEGDLGRHRDGRLSGAIGLTLHEDEAKIIERIRRTVEVRFASRISVYPVVGSRAITVRFSCLPLAHLLEALCGSGAHNKRIPEAVLCGTDGVRSGFLAGVLDGDGRDPSSPGNSGRQCLKSASPHLVWGVRALLASVGHWPTVYTGEAPGAFPSPGSRPSYRYFGISYTPDRSFSRTLHDSQMMYRPVGTVQHDSGHAEVYRVSVESDGSLVSDIILRAD
jgi:hypothetical protein